jgi:hypothetical protein
MKRALFLIALTAWWFSSAAQCVPDTSITTSGYYPDSATGLPHAVVGVPYSTDIQVLVPATYTIFDIDSVVLDSVGGLPPGFVTSCTPSSCHLLPLANGCMLISGPAFSAASAGSVFPLTIYLTGYLSFLGSPVPAQHQTVGFYSIVVDQPSGIAALNGSAFSVTQNAPNPFSGLTKLEVTCATAEDLRITVSTILGSRVESRTVSTRPGQNEILFHAHDFTPGVYLYTVSNGTATVTRRMIVATNNDF